MGRPGKEHIMDCFRWVLFHMVVQTESFAMILQSGLRFIAGINSYISVKGIMHSNPTILNNKLILIPFCSSLNEKDEEQLIGSD